MKTSTIGETAVQYPSISQLDSTKRSNWNGREVYKEAPSAMHITIIALSAILYMATLLLIPGGGYPMYYYGFSMYESPIAGILAGAWGSATIAFAAYTLASINAGKTSKGM